MKLRLYQILRQAGVINTRDDAISLLKQGKVKIDGRICPIPNFQVDPQKSNITVNGKPLPKKVEHKYYLLNKPMNYLTSRKRSHGKRNLMELIKVPKALHNSLSPVGRLDYNTTGLIIITNDGHFARKILDPNSKVEKEYIVLIKGILSFEDIAKIQTGFKIDLEEGQYHTKPAQVSNLKKTSATTEFHLTITEGKKRQIRKMMAKLGHRVLSLHRIRIGPYNLANIKEGEYKEFTPKK